MLSQGYTIGMLEQEPKLDDSKTVIEIVREGAQEFVNILNEYEEVNNKFAEEMTPEEMDKLINRQAALQEKIDLHDLWNLDNRLEQAMEALRCPESNTPINILSGGERRRVALCRLLLQEPDILLLDEPTNHLDAESVQWLEMHLQQYKGTVIAVTHDRYFLDNIAGWILELDRGEGIPWKGNYSSWLEQKGERLRMEEKTESKRQKTLARELDWVRMGVKGRGVKAKARLSAYDKLLSEDSKTTEDKLELFIPNGSRLGNEVIEAIGVAKGYGDRLLYENLNFKLPPAGIVGIIGPNGAGKTTLFKMIMGMETPNAGSFKVGPTVKISYVDQTHKAIDPNKTVYDVLSGGLDNITIGGRPMNSRAYISKFNFAGNDQSKKCNVLSGGERNRLHLALALQEEGNVLLLDEPTNDLDVNTLRALEEGLEYFAGCAVIISHDRWFLDRVCTHILAFEDNSSVYYFEGGYSEYEENKKKRLGNVEPKRPKYKKLTI
jgi:energy-dependent translational throttle protein EttA